MILSYIKFGVEYLLRKKNVSLHGVKFKIPENIDTKTLRSMYSRRYERSEYDCISKELTAGQAVLEIGGGCGFLSTFLQQKMSPTKHYVIEPLADNFSAIKSQVGSRNMNLFNGAFDIDNDSGHVKFFRADRKFGSGIVGDKGVENRAGEFIQVPVFDKESVDLNEFSWIIVDVEGYEETLLPWLVNNTNANIIFEYHHDKVGCSLSELLEKLSGVIVEHFSGATFVLKRVDHV